MLAVTSVGVTENFFDIGGHSLLATQVMSRISSSVGVDIPLRKIFEGPTIEDLASRVAQELRKADRVDAPQITKLPRAEGMSLPLSFAQQRLWFIDQLLPDSGAYNISSAFRLSGSLNAHALELSFNRILLRHEVLRTRFLQLDGHPVQIIDPVLSIKLALIDLQPLSDHHQQLALKLAASQVASNGFDLSAGPLIRVCLVRCSLHEHVLLLTLHHIVTDGWSTSILMSELNHFYHGYLSGEPLPLQELDIQYADYAAWQRDWLKGDILHLQLQYWRQQLLGMQTVLEIPTDRLRPPTHSLRRSWQSMSIPLETSSSFISHTSAQAATLYMSMLAAFAVVLWRNTGLTDISIGSPVANRKRGELEKLIGCFVNTVVMRVQIDEEASFSDLVTSVREVALGAYAHEETPFEKVVEMMQPERSMNRAPLVQVTLTMQNAPRGKLVIGDREVTGMRAASGAGAAAAMEYDLSLIVGEAEKTIAGILIYNEDLYEAQTISRLVNQMQRVIETVTRAWDSKLLSLDLISQQERSQILAAGNPGTTLYLINRTIAEVFEQEAENRRSAIALQCGQEAITYQQLNTKANRLGNYLRELGVGPEVMVGIMMDRGIEMIVSMLAILKAGGAYVPIDEQYPMERIAFQIEDAAIGIVVTKKEYAGKVPALMVQVVEVDEQCDEIGNRDEHNLEVEAAADNLAYVIYTSGSTGNPKGVEIQHRSVIRLVKAAQYVNLDHLQTILQASTLSFDAATFEIWGALLNGAKLVVLQSRLATGHELSAIIAEQAVSTLWLTSSLYNAIADERVDYLQGLKQLLVGGEALSVKHIREGVRRLKGLSMINGYGPTEGTTFTCCHQIGEADVEEGRQTVAIGTGITNTFVYVLDKWMEIVPIGVAGELYIGGDGLARGYLNRPEITAQKFIPNPFCKEAGHRLYRTGDICRWNADGKIDYIARSDFQVKVRGYRIELGEIEATLERDASVKQAVVVLKQDAADKRLIAYVVADEAVEVTSDELRSFLKSRLPDYMIPAGIIVLAQMPLTANGKVDRPGLAQRDWVIQLTEQYVEASTPQEKALAEVWKEVLGAQRVGIKENYFELGGDSIRGIRVVAKARDRGVRVSIQDLFQYPTIEELAMQAGEVIQQAQEHRKEFTLISEHDRRKLPEGVEDAYPLSRIQAGMVFHSQYNEGSAVYHDIISYRIKGEYEEAAMRRSIERLIQRHEMLRTGMELDGYSEPLQLVYERVEAPLEMQDISNRSEAEQEEEVERWIEQEKREGFEWGKAPLMRIKVTRRGKEDYQLSISFHHAILDGWSFASLLVELYQEYWEEIGKEGGRKWEKPRSKYREYVRAEREAIQSEQERMYWKKKLEGVKGTKVGKGENRGEKRIRHRGKEFSSEMFKRVKDVAKEMEVPVKSVLLGAHMRVMSAVTGEDDVVSGLVMNGRLEEEDGERVLGVFLNTLPIRIGLRGGTWKELVREAFEQEKEVMNHRMYPLSEMQWMKGREELFDTLFMLLDFHVKGELREGGGVQVTGYKDVIETNYPLVIIFSVDQKSGGLRLGISYDEGELDEQEIRWLEDYYGRVLEKIVVDSSGRYEFDSLLTEGETNLVLNYARSQAKGVEGRGIYPLSPEQKSLWDLCQDRVASLNQTVCLRARVDSPVDMEAFERSLEALIARHEILRTTITTLNGNTVQQINSTTDFRLAVIEAPEKTISYHLLENFTANLSRLSFDLERGPLFKFFLIRVPDGECALILTMSTILCDGLSIGILLDDLETLYASFKRGSGNQLPPLEVQYKDYAIWHSQQIIEDGMTESQRYWQTKLQGASLGLHLPTDYFPSVTARIESGLIRFAINKDVTSRLNKLAGQDRMRLFAILKSAFYALSYRYTGQNDLVLLSPMSARDDFQGQIGCYSNIVALRVQVYAEDTFANLIQKVEQVAFDAGKYRAHSLRDLLAEPFDSESIKKERLIRTGLTLESDYMRRRLIEADFPITLFEQDLKAIEYDLWCFLGETEGKIEAGLKYNATLFDEGTIELMVSRYLILIERLVSNPQTKIIDIEFFSEPLDTTEPEEVQIELSL